ncbi:hypothetical protein J2T56_002793 [Natronobacillus azotifigens]|uniref:Uncharacterized protein n=1 Tax=Natronobacillus azotifigens TaxID=472978 RepID=A0A9J6RFQ4_9BACI|nr:hypothetical protein [Natronobacillus azotifigens]MCZ0704391.1 hypothetical protein [Natronobacillus azotifigens]
MNNMLALYEDNQATATPQIHIEESKMYYYHPQRNSNGIRSFDLTTAYDNVAPLHEGGRSIANSELMGLIYYLMVSLDIEFL